MNDITAFGVAGTAHAAGALHGVGNVSPATAEMSTLHPAPTANAVWAVADIAQPRKRRTAEATDASVNRGFV